MIVKGRFSNAATLSTVISLHSAVKECLFFPLCIFVYIRIDSGFFNLVHYCLLLFLMLMLRLSQIQQVAPLSNWLFESFCYIIIILRTVYFVIQSTVAHSPCTLLVLQNKLAISSRNHGFFSLVGKGV